MYYIIEFACIVAEVCYIHIFLRSVNAKRVRASLKMWICYVAFGVIITALSFFSDNSVLRLCTTFLGTALISCILFKSEVITALFSSFLFVAFVALTDIIVMILFSLFGINNEILMASGKGRILYIISAHIFLLGIVAAACLVNRHGSSIVTVKTLLPLLPCWFVSILLGCMLCTAVDRNFFDIHPLYLFVMLGLLYTNIAIVYLSNKLSEEEQNRRNVELAEHHYAMQKEYYQQLHAQQEETRALWHDISKYMRAMQALTLENHSEEAHNVFSQVQAFMDNIDGVVDVSNRVVSVILNEYMAAARELNVKVTMDVRIPNELFVTAADLYVLIGNTMDNALDACSEVDEEKRKIELRLLLHNGILFYQISNPYRKDHKKRKRNQFHGYGLKNVGRCVERYDGILSTDDSNGIFCVTARLNSI